MARCPRACPELVEGFAPHLSALTWDSSSVRRFNSLLAPMRQPAATSTSRGGFARGVWRGRHIIAQRFNAG